MALYPFQQRVYEQLMAGRSVILQAPTGAGKTRAALYPFLRAWEENQDFPRKCIYSVPMRVLANQFWDEYEERSRNFGFVQPMDVTIQTGARSEDTKLEGNLIFTTIDQTLSNFLNIPYALSLGQGNLNAGAVLSSYLVFDELHLFDLETTLPTTLYLLRLLRGVVPFVIMTATFSTKRIQSLARELDAEPMVLSADEAAGIPSQHKARRIHTVDGLLLPEAVVGHHCRRSIAICNTVNRAQDLYEGIRQLVGPEVEVRLLHSRFLRTHRDDSEAWLQREFGEDKAQHTVKSAILVATQVVEVGLDISSEVLHSELAPAASVIQRAGRCARYQGEEGNVYVYQLPLDKRGQPSFAPYGSSGQADVCERTWEALQARDGETYDFARELAVVDHAHGPADQMLVEQLRAHRHYVADRIAATIDAQERGAAPELIRAVDSRTVIVHPDPRSIENPWIFEGFSFFRGSLFGAYDDLEMLADELGEDWVLMTADAKPEDPEASRSRTVYDWRLIVGKDDLVGALLVAVNPALASYSPEVGFQLARPGDSAWQSPLSENRKARRSFPPYRRETLVEHVRRMVSVYEYPFFDRQARKERRPLAEELAYVAHRLEQRQGWPTDMLDRLLRMVIAVHDLGKLDVKWQDWATRWQVEVSRRRGLDLTISDDYLAAHTDYDGQDDLERDAAQKLRHLRPNHAAESAAAAMAWLLDQIGDQALARAALTAIVRHHSAGAVGKHDDFQAHVAAPDAFQQILAVAGLDDLNGEGVAWSLSAGEELINRQIRPKREAELLSYLLIVRALRLADQRSQEWNE